MSRESWNELKNSLSTLGLSPVFFLISAVLGLWIAYDFGTAVFRFALIIAGLLLYGSMGLVPEKLRLPGSKEVPLLRISLALLPAVLASYFLLTTDWASRLEKLPWLDPALRAFTGWLPHLTIYSINANVTGGILAAFIPLQIAALRLTPKRYAGPLVLLSLLALLLSELRGAMLALGVITLSWGFWKGYSWLSQRRSIERQNLIWVAALALAAVCLTILMVTPLGSVLLGLRPDRWEVWHNSLDLASDYAFTGLGLGSFEMAYSSYVLLVHVGHTLHAHDLFLDMWLQFGALGLLSFAGMTIAGLQARGNASAWRVAALASLGVILLHGFVDDVFLGYGAKATPLLFVPLGLLMRGASRQKVHSCILPIFYCSAVALFVISVLLPGGRAAFIANLGALSQTRAELSIYRWPAWSIQDELRRSPQIDLTSALSLYYTALQLDPTNATANRRLAQIELARGQYDAARQRLTAAYAAAPQQRATRQLLGESYAVAGEVDRAATLWKSIDVSNDQLQLRQWWYEHIGKLEQAQAVAQAAARLSQ